ncbi:galactitol-1-phosphate 5-dehydrogenase [Galbibacter sp. BG1]|uniref:galactitol-1-phosphate 5-dehydrogenase n=1 Tax=Galbibacter sp. BG1 TaxID=1170699 RepID=UPI0015B8AC89|nr:galactitol-1-phosphate 5-dehydrogenase [Galbibacter sp. BG1]QLE02065.1 galactitol-1-phosphate 5-dehydrogenase [Galbibacter sp. BG1]
MKALVLKENGKLIVENDRPLESINAPNTVLVKIAACGICGSDIPRAFDNGAYFYPLVLGHEFSGTIAEDKLELGFAKGQHVAVFPLIPKNKKEKAYQTGDYAQLKEYNYFGSRCDGGFQEYLRVPVENLFKVPKHVNLLHAAMTEPAAVALHGVRKMSINAGDTGLVLGGGPIGNLTAQWLRIHGCKEVYVVDIDDRKLEIAQKMGFYPINSSHKNLYDTIMELTNQEGVHRVVEACGLPITFLQALQMAARGGEVVFMGNIHGEFKIGEKDFSSLLRRELRIYGTWNSKIVPRGEDDWSTVLKYMDKELEVKPLISDIVTLSEAPAIFDSIYKQKAFHNKVIVTPN